VRRILRVLTVAALCAATASTGLPAASASEGGLLRLAHLSPDTPDVDVYVDSVSDPAARLTLPGVGYGAVSPYQRVPDGTYAISMRTAGADPATPPVLTTTVDVHGAQARTVAGLGSFATLGLKVLDDDLTLPPAGRARVRVVDAAAAAATLSVSVPDGRQVATQLPFATGTQYVDVPGGTTSLSFDPGSGAEDLPVDLAAGSVYTVLVLDAPGGALQVRTALDAASPGVVPAGPVEAGGGGTAGPSTGSTVALAAVGVAALAGAGLLTGGRGRLPRRGTPRHAAGR
jgi:hypothetical protein